MTDTTRDEDADLVRLRAATYWDEEATTDDAVERAALTHARAFVPDVQEVINDDAGDDPDPQWVYDRLIESLAVIDRLAEAFGAEHATRVGEIAARAALAAAGWPDEDLRGDDRD